MNAYVVTAMFSSRINGERAIGQLVQELHAECTIVCVTDEDDNGSCPYGLHELPAALSGLLISDDDRCTLLEGLGRSCVLVLAAVRESETSRAAEVLDAAGALDLDAQAELWGLCDAPG